MSDETAENASPEVTKLREELGYLTNTFFVLGNGNIKGSEAHYAVKVLAYLDSLVVAKTDELNSRIATETLGKPVQMNGDVLSMVKEQATH